MSSKIYNIDEKNVSIVFNKKYVKIIGNIDGKDPEQIRASFFNDVHDYIVKHKLKSIEVDIMELDFLNSSGIKEFVDWIMKAASLPKDKIYTIIFLCNHELLWQASNIKVLSFLSKDYVKIEIK